MNVNKLNRSPTPTKQPPAPSPIGPPAASPKPEDFQVLELTKERDLLAEEIPFSKSASEYSSHCYAILRKYEQYAEEFHRELRANYENNQRVNAYVQDSVFRELEARDRLRAELDGRLAEAEAVIRGLRQQTLEALARVHANNVDSLERAAAEGMAKLFARLSELEASNSQNQKNYIGRLTKLLETRKSVGGG